MYPANIPGYANIPLISSYHQELSQQQAQSQVLSSEQSQQQQSQSQSQVQHQSQQSQQPTSQSSNQSHDKGKSLQRYFYIDSIAYIKVKSYHKNQIFHSI